MGAENNDDYSKFGRRFVSLYVREAGRRMSRRAALARLRLTRHTVRVPERLIVAPTDLRSIDPFVAAEIINGIDVYRSTPHGQGRVPQGISAGTVGRLRF